MRKIANAAAVLRLQVNNLSKRPKSVQSLDAVSANANAAASGALQLPAIWAKLF